MSTNRVRLVRPRFPAFLSRLIGAGLALAVLAPVSAEHLAPAEAAKIDQIFARWDKPGSPGAIVAIARDGETVFARGYGLANLDYGVPLTVDTLSETGSVAKQFTAAAVTLLAVRGKLSLDDSLKQHLPEVPAFGRDITLRMLLDHTSGLRDIHGLFDLLGRPTYAGAHENSEVLEIVRRQRELNFPPGTEYAYCNTGYLLLTFVVARVSGRPFAEFCRDEVFLRHGLTHTAWRTQFDQVVPGRAAAYALERDGRFRVDLPYSNIHGNGGLLTTVGDLLRWNDLLDHPEGEWAEVVRLMHTPSKLKSGQPIENGLGLRLGQYRGTADISHSGGTAGYSTFLARFPEHHLSIAVLGNIYALDGGAHTYRIVDALIGSQLAPVERPAPVTLPVEELAAHTGLYRSPEHDLLVRVSLLDDKLFLNGAPLTPTGPHTFVGPTGTLYTFDRVRDGRPRHLAFTANRIARSFNAVQAATPTVEKLAEYVGDYHCPELDVTLPVTLDRGRLVARVWP
ncbi:MAG: serine hydrolase, partial [Verrucomicrobia bacterium]|nr:serine hydrolase [Verrucomicrobiota bacterium]